MGLAATEERPKRDGEGGVLCGPPAREAGKVRGRLWPDRVPRREEVGPCLG